MKSCKTCVYQYRDKCLLTLKAATGPACDDYEEPEKRGTNLTAGEHDR